MTGLQDVWVQGVADVRRTHCPPRFFWGATHKGVCGDYGGELLASDRTGKEEQGHRLSLCPWICRGGR